MGYAIQDLRDLTRQFVRQAADSTMYSNVQVDNAIMLAADEWMRITSASRTLGTMNMTAGTATLGVVPTAWAPEFHMKAYLTFAGALVNPEVAFIDYDQALLFQQQLGTSSSFTQGIPKYFAFGDGGTTTTFTPTLSIVVPTPDQAYTLNLWYWQRFTSWTAGGTCNSFNLPDEQLRIIATDGCESIIQANEPDNAARAAAAGVRFLNKANDIKNRNAGGRSGNVSYKDDACSWWDCTATGYEGQRAGGW